MRYLAVLSLALAALHAQTPPRRLTLSEAGALALRNNPRLALDDLAPRITDEITSEIRSALFPSISANSSAAGALRDSRLAAGALNNPIIFSRFALGTSVNQLVTDFGRTSHLVESSRLRAESQRSAAEAGRAQVLLTVHRAFFAALRARAVARVAEATLRARELVLEQISALAKSSLKSTLDVSFAQVNVSEAKLLLATTQNEYESALAELSAAMGFAQPQAFELVESDFVSSPPPTLDDALSQARSSRPEMRALQQERDSAERFARAEAKLNLPTVSALANAGVAPLRDDRLRGNFAAAGVTLNVPVFNGHLFSARQREADLRVQAVNQRMKELENVIAREMALAVLQAQNAYQRIALTADLVKQAELTQDLAQERYTLGLSSIVELNQAQLNKTTAEIRLVVARFDYQLLNSLIAFQAGRLR